MFASKYLDNKISYECEVFSRKTMLRLLCKSLILRLYDTHDTVVVWFNTRHSDMYSVAAKNDCSVTLAYKLIFQIKGMFFRHS